MPGHVKQTPAAARPGGEPAGPRPCGGWGMTIGDREFALFRDLVRAHTGISLSPQKRYLLQARLGKRLRALGLATYADYHRRLVEEGDTRGELTRFINAITTNKTDFFREAHHFEYLRDVVVPRFKARRAAGGDGRLRIWSAGCSSGEEPYTIAMTVREALGAGAGWDVKILASDIDTDILTRAAGGVYPLVQADPIPKRLLARYFLHGAAGQAGLVRVGPELQAMIRFRRINFLDEPWPIRTSFDVIFCRNVLIYFDRPTQQRILERLVGFLKADGLLFLGHSESVHGLVMGLAHLGHTIYQRMAPATPATGGGARAPREG